jgi:hypothetical protein
MRLAASYERLAENIENAIARLPALRNCAE